MPAAGRFFFAIWPDATALNALDAAARLGAEHCAGRYVGRDNLHMTLAFVGAASSDQLATLHEVGARVRAAPFEMLLDHLGWWPHNRVFWVGCRTVPSRQRRLFADLSETLAATGFPPDMRPPVPHVTLLRQARCNALPALAAEIRWPAREFALVESCSPASGVRYRTLARWLLQETA
jgi:2'-5' RNA ligase